MLSLQSAELAKTAEPGRFGKRVSTPADDPIAAVHIMELSARRPNRSSSARTAR